MINYEALVEVKIVYMKFILIAIHKIIQLMKLHVENGVLQTL